MTIAVTLLVNNNDHTCVLPGAIVDLRGTLCEPFYGSKARLVGGISPQKGAVFFERQGAYCPMGVDPARAGLSWVTDDQWKDMLVADGCPPDIAEEMVCEAIDMLGKHSYIKGLV